VGIGKGDGLIRNLSVLVVANRFALMPQIPLKCEPAVTCTIHAKIRVSQPYMKKGRRTNPKQPHRENIYSIHTHLFAWLQRVLWKRQKCLRLLGV
jgi:hypothetical protein